MVPQPDSLCPEGIHRLASLKEMAQKRVFFQQVLCNLRKTRSSLTLAWPVLAPNIQSWDLSLQKWELKHPFSSFLLSLSLTAFFLLWTMPLPRTAGPPCWG